MSFPRVEMMRSRWWAGWCENAIQQSEEMPGMRACDEEERTDRQGHATVEMPGLPAELDDAAARPQTARTLEEFLSWLPGRRPRRRRNPRATRAPAQADRMVLVNPAAHRPPDAKRHTVMADGTYMGHAGA